MILHSLAHQILKTKTSENKKQNKGRWDRYRHHSYHRETEAHENSTELPSLYTTDCSL